MSTPVDTVLAAVKNGSAGPAELSAALSAAPLLFAVATGREDTALPYLVRYDDLDHGVVCTSPQYANLLSDVPAFAEITGRDLGARWPDGLRVVINPGTPLALALDGAAMRRLGSTAEQLPAGTSYAVGAPADAPDPALVEAVRGALRNVGGAENAYLFQFGTGGTSRLVCGLVLAAGVDPGSVIPPIADAVAHTYPPARSLDYTPLSGQLLANVAEYVTPVR